jgi:hypothetical protein
VALLKTVTIVKIMKTLKIVKILPDAYVHCPFSRLQSPLAEQSSGQRVCAQSKPMYGYSHSQAGSYLQRLTITARRRCGWLFERH